MTSSKRKSPSPIVRAYMAGLFDGEGCFSTTMVKSGSMRVSCSVSMVDKEPIEFIHSLYDSTVHIAHAKHKSWKPCHKVQLNLKGITQFIADVMPYLRVKKEQAKTIKFWLETKENCSGRSGVSEKQLDLNIMTNAIIKRLNKRGANAH